MDGDPTPDESSTALWILPTVLGTPPPERWGHSAVQLENKMYIFGVQTTLLHTSLFLFLSFICFWFLFVFFFFALFFCYVSSLSL